MAFVERVKAFQLPVKVVKDTDGQWKLSSKARGLLTQP